MGKIYLMEYFENSLFFKGTTNPSGKNIAPKVLADNEFESYVENHERVANYEDFSMLTIDGTITLKTERQKRRVENPFARSIRVVPLAPYTMRDEVEYKSIISAISEGIVSISTELSVDRQIFGVSEIALEKVLSRDGLFPYPHEDGNFSIIIEEFFCKMSDQEHVLHYSEYSDAFEIYTIKTLEDIDVCSFEEVEVYELSTADKANPLVKEALSLMSDECMLKKLTY